MDNRNTRLYTTEGSSSRNPNDVRTEFEHDYDRVIYDAYFRRLADVTQVFNADEGVIFHNRLTHSLKVSQIGKRLAKLLLSRNDSKLIEEVGGLDPEVVATAGLIHDLGNPPFGHAAEAQLDKLIKGHLPEGFEGNAQSFRIVTRLASHIPKIGGLNLTIATLNAVLKYPWLYDDRPNPNKNKYGAYREDEKIFNWARSLYPELGTKKSLEANIMDLSDDLSYAIHDLLDLWRSNLTPLLAYYQLFVADSNIRNFVLKNWESNKSLISPLVKELIDELIDVQEEWAPSWKTGNLSSIMDSIISFFKFIGNFLIMPNGQYRGTHDGRVQLKNIESIFINRFFQFVMIDSSKANNSYLIVQSPACDEIIILKALTSSYIKNSPNLITQQYGEIKIINSLFDAFAEAVENPKLRMIFPAKAREQLEERKITKVGVDGSYRIIADAISGLTDTEAKNLYNKLSGTKPGSIADLSFP